jgi:hypothetical protein
VALYGGSAGYKSSLDERDWAANPTVLSGDLGDNDVHIRVIQGGTGPYGFVELADLAMVK